MMRLARAVNSGGKTESGRVGSRVKSRRGVPSIFCSAALADATNCEAKAQKHGADAGSETAQKMTASLRLQQCKLSLGDAMSPVNSPRIRSWIGFRDLT